MFSHLRRQKPPRPLAIGAVGGSGTRVIARFLSSVGYFIGSDLNDASDNLWFTLLFKRRDILLESRQGFRSTAELFFHRMEGRLGRPNDSTVHYVRALAKQSRLQHSSVWLAERADTFLGESEPSDNPRSLWGWKEPNTHVVIGQLLETNPQLRYIHVVRNGLDMAFSENQNQLEFWGPIFLGREAEPTPRRALSYWCAVDRRVNTIAKMFPDRVMFVDFDEFCTNPRDRCRDILHFCGLGFMGAAIDEFIRTVQAPQSVGRFRSEDTAALDPTDLNYVRGRGYPIE